MSDSHRDGVAAHLEVQEGDASRYRRDSAVAQERLSREQRAEQIPSQRRLPYLALRRDEHGCPPRGQGIDAVTGRGGTAQHLAESGHVGAGAVRTTLGGEEALNVVSHAARLQRGAKLRGVGLLVGREKRQCLAHQVWVRGDGGH
jgi:hypothetical protein